MKNRFQLFPVALLAVSASAFGADYVVDNSHSHVGFTVRHIVSKVLGEFKDYEGSFVFDEKKPETSKVDFTIKTASINTNNEKRDEHLRSGDFFDAEKHPTLTFKNGKLTKAGKDKFKLAGDLTMRGVTKPVTFDVEYLGGGKDPWGNQKVGFSAKTKVKRTDYGMSFNKTLETGGVLVGEDVEIQLEIEANAKKM